MFLVVSEFSINYYFDTGNNDNNNSMFYSESLTSFNFVSNQMYAAIDQEDMRFTVYPLENADSRISGQDGNTPKVILSYPLVP